MNPSAIVRNLPWLALSLLLAAQVANGQAIQDCSPPHRIDWPSGQPVWSLCWISPDNSSGIDGSGLELRDVYFKGRRVLRRAGIPVLNVNYDPGGCGSLRDWQNGLANFEADGALVPRYAEPAAPPQTMCRIPGTDVGDFQGVAAEKKLKELVLTTQMQAGPYRYTQKWTFRLDGSIDAQIAFTALESPCNVKPHDHHAYWRLEFDIGGDGKDYAEEANPRGSQGTPQWKRIFSETSRRNDALVGGAWRVLSSSGHRGYEVASPPGFGVSNSWAVADFWVLKFHPEELDDGGARPGADGSGNAVQLNRYLNRESVDGVNVVFWVHAMDRHENSGRCRFVGPTLRPVGKW